MSLLHGTNIKLRAVEPEDLDLLLEWENDPENWLVSGTLNPFSKSVMQAYIENSHLSIYQTNQYRFMIELLDSEICIGSVDLFDFDPFHKRAGLGILIGEKEYRGEGNAKQALNLVINYSFNHLDLHQLYCNILSENEVSLSLFRKQGFVNCGIKKDWIRDKSEYKDEIILQLLKEKND